MFNRFRTALSASILLGALTIGLPLTTSGHTYSPAHYNAACSTGAGASQGQYYALMSGNYIGVRSTTVTAVLAPCVSASGSNGGWSIVNAATAQRVSPTGAVAQFGYAQQACAPGYCLPDWVNQRMDFWFTKYDNNGGGIYDAEWVDELDGNTADHDFPYIGDSYLFAITERNDNGGNQWRYCITVVASAIYPVGNNDCHDEPRTSNDHFEWSYWAAEVYNPASAIGNRNDAPTPMVIYPMQYQLTSTGAWTSVQGSDTSCQWSSQTGLNNPPAGYQCYESPAGTSQLHIWTTSHQ